MVERVEARPSRDAGARRPRHGVRREGGGDRDESHPTVGGLEKFCFPGLVEVLTGAGAHESGGPGVLSGKARSEGAVIPRVIVRVGDHVKARPSQFVGHLGISPHPCASALIGRVRFVVVQEHLQVREGHIGASEEFDHLQVARLHVTGEGPGDDGVAGEHHRHEPIARNRRIRSRGLSDGHGRRGEKEAGGEECGSSVHSGL